MEQSGRVMRPGMNLREEKTFFVSHLMYILELLKSRDVIALIRTRDYSRSWVISFLAGLISGGFRDCCSSTGASSFQDKSDQSSVFRAPEEPLSELPSFGSLRKPGSPTWGKWWGPVNSHTPFNHRSSSARKSEETPTCHRL